MSVHTQRTALLAGALALLSSAATFAESASGGGSAARIEEVVVTAQRREQSIKDVPQAVQAMSGQYLEDTNVRSLAETIDLIPSASQVSSISAASTVYQIRAIAPSENSGDATVGYYVDNFAFSIPALPYAPVVAATSVSGS